MSESEFERKDEENREKFKKLIAQYPESVAKFGSYYKYLFSFITVINGSKWEFTVGGDSDDIYRFGVQPETLVKKILLETTLQNAWEIIDKNKKLEDF